METLLLKKRIWSSLILFLVLFFTTLSFGQTVTLDQADLDYAPGETVFITGTGWQPNEVITLRIDHLTEPIPDHGTPNPHLPWTIVADNSGNINSSWFVTEYELGSDLLLVAEGSESGVTYEVFFTDGLNLCAACNERIICNGGQTTFSVNETAGSVFAVWQVSTDGGTSWANLSNVAPYSGVTSTTLTINPVGSSMNGYKYRGKATNNTTFSNAGLLTVNPVSVGGSATTSTALPLCPNGSAVLSVNGSIGTVVRWQDSTDGVTFTNIGGSNGSPYTVNNISAPTYYRAEVKSGVCTSAFSDKILITVNSKPNIASNPSNQTANVGGNASFNVLATGTGLSFQWQVNTGNGFSNLTIAPPYSVVNTATSSVLSITGATLAMNGYSFKCQVSGTCPSAVTSGAASLTVNNPCIAPTLSEIHTNVSCKDADNGSITLTTIGGNPAPFTYLWSNGATTKDVSGLAPGNYTVTVTTASGGCSVTSEIITITEPNLLTATVSNVDVSCNGADDGSISVSNPSGGYGTYEYRLNSGAWQASGDFNGLSPATYSVQLRDAAHTDCVVVLGDQLITEPNLLAATVSNVDVSCNGADDGSISVSNPSGGYGTYEYRLNSGAWQSSGDFSGLSPATYSVQLRDAAHTDCVVVLGDQLITEPNLLAATVSNVDVSCNGADDGSISVSNPSGGYGTYEYRLNSGAWQSSGDFSGLSPATYSVQLRDAAHTDCVVVLGDQLITEPNLLAATVSNVDVSCNGADDGSILVSNPSGGYGTYEYRLNSGAWQSSGNFSGLSPATYSVQLRDAAHTNCVVVLGDQLITEPSPLFASISSDKPVLYFGYPGDQSATITAIASGGTAPYIVKITMVNGANASIRDNGKLICNYVNANGDEVWTSGANTNSVLSTGITCATNSVTASSTSNALTPPALNTTVNYSVNVKLLADARFIATVTDANGCSYTIPYEEAARVDAEDVRCFSGNSGAAKITVCHKTGSLKNPCVAICVDESAVAEHLAHGDFLGKCTSTCLPATSNSKTEPHFNVIAYPNPSNNQFTFEIESESTESTDITVFDIAGRMVKQVRNRESDTITFGEELPRGVYLAVIEQGSNRKTVRIVKE